MQGWLIGLVVAAVLIGGTILGITAIFLVPIAGIIALIALLIWFGRRRAEHKPPIE